MRLLLFFRTRLVVALLAPAGVVAQSFEIPPVGTDETFNVATWNIEHFGVEGEGPSDIELQFANVLSVMQQANVHLWALQEMNSQFTFNNLVAALGDGWAGFWQPDLTQFSIGYGFIYRTDRVQPIGTPTTILTNNAYDFAFRPPLQMRANLTFPQGNVSNVRFINVHAKCCGGFEDWNRRSTASAVLKNYVDNLQAANFPVLVLGDLNDQLRTSISSGRPSPYANFRTDTENYHFGTLSLEDTGVNTFCFNSTCTSGSTIDHILIGRPLFDAYEENSTARYDALLTNIPNYINRPNINGTTSDHVAVYARFDFFKPVSSDGGTTVEKFGLEAPFPNPFRNEATVVYTLAEPGTVKLEVFDALGRRVSLLENRARPAGRHEASLSGTALTPGLYLVRLTTSSPAGDRTATRRLVRLP